MVSVYLWRRWIGPVLLFLSFLSCLLALSSCSSASVSSSSVSSSAPTPMSAIAATATSLATATAVAASTAIAQDNCPQMTSGPHVTLAEPSLLLTITYPTTLKEMHCPLTHNSDGSWYLRVGNFVDLYVKPAAGRTIQQYVDATRMPYETVALTPITGVRAQEAYLVQNHLTADAPGPGYYNNKSIVALLRGSQYIYEVAEIQSGEWPVATDNVIPNSQKLSDFLTGFSVS